MKLDIKICWKQDILESSYSFEIKKFVHHKGDVQTITVDCDYIEDHDDLMQEIEDKIGDSFIEGEDFELINEEQFWQDMDCSASKITNSDALDGRLEKIREVLRRYFDVDDDGNASKTFDEDYTAQAAIDDIHEIVGNI